MTQYGFGTGQLFTTPVGGGAPLRIGALQDVTLDISGDLKMLYGQYQFPLDVARGKMKIEGKIGTANIDVAAFNSFFFGKTVTTGQKKQVINEAGTIPGTPFQLTAANGATFVQDLGVYDVLTGNPLTQVPSGTPATGQYKVSAAGVYTFAAADTGKAVLLNYIYTDTVNGGTLSITNDLMGSAPSFQLYMSQQYKSNQVMVCLYSVVTSKLALPLKQEDHTVSEIDYTAQANSAGNIGYITTTSAVGGGA